MNKIVLLNYSLNKVGSKKALQQIFTSFELQQYMGFRKVQKCSKDLRISWLETYCIFARTFVGLCCSVVFTFVNHSQKLRICQKYYQFQNGTPCRKEVFSPIQYYRHVLDSHYNKLYYTGLLSTNWIFSVLHYSSLK